MTPPEPGDLEMDLEVDVVVVGAGGRGLAAAVAAADGAALTALDTAGYRGEELPLITAIPAIWPTLLRA